MKRIVNILSLVCAFTLTAGVAMAQAQKSAYTPQGYIDQVLKKNPNFINAVTAIKAVDENGKTIAEWNSTHPVLTASTLKTITTGLGLVYLGEDYRFTTTLSYSGKISGGLLRGNLYIIGGGDPTLGSEDPVAYKIDSIFGVWTAAMKALGINKVEGNVIVDDRYLAREVIPSSWTWGNIGYDYGSAPSGLPFHEDVQNVKIVPGKSVGEPAKVIVTYPFIPDFKYVNNLTTGPAKSGDWSEYFVSDLARVGKFEGTVPMDRDTIRSTISNKFAYLSCGLAFRDYLISQGISVDPEIYAVEEVKAEEPLTQIVQTTSPELWKIVEVTNHISNNFYAETIFKTLGKKMFGEGTYSAATKAAIKLIDSLGVNKVGYTQDDGSGLSRENYLSPAFFCRFCTMMAKQPVFEKYIASFPYSGVGTLRNVLKAKQFNPEIAGRVHAKSGSLSCVKTYAGYVYAGPKHGLIKFAILVNNYSCKTSEIQKGLEGFMYSLASAD